MSLHPAEERTIPEETVRVARAASPNASISMRIRDALGPIYTDAAFASLFPNLIPRGLYQRVHSYAGRARFVARLHEPMVGR